MARFRSTRPEATIWVKALMTEPTWRNPCAFGYLITFNALGMFLTSHGLPTGRGCWNRDHSALAKPMLGGCSGQFTGTFDESCNKTGLEYVSLKGYENL